MSCPACGETIQPGQRFCASCGQALPRTCPACAAALPDAARFCPACGTAVDPAPAAQPPPARGPDAAPASAPTAEPAVERRRVSVLFVDLVGFTELAGRADPEETRTLQARYFERAQELVERYGGRVEKYIGDAVMAAWGAPTANEDDAERAVRAGLDLLGAVAGLGDPSGAPLAARAGVATGEVAVSRGRDGELLLSGDAVNLGARLQGAAPTGSLLADRATRDAGEAAIAFEPLPDLALKGVGAAVPVWRAERVVAGRGGMGRPGELEPPFVGRDSELTLLKELFHATARERRLRVVSITGQAGIGKSRLAWEFEKYVGAIDLDVRWHQGRSPAYGEGITFWALGEMVRRRAEITEGDDAATTADKLRAVVARHVPDEEEAARVEAALRVLLAIEERAPAERGELFGAWRHLFERLADEQPVVLVFEDLQWADSGLVDFIGHLLEWSRQYPIFVVTLARPELVDRFPAWGAGQRNFTSLHLEPLADAEMRTLLAGLVPGLAGPSVRAILGRAEGVPLYAVETVRMLVGNGALVRDGETYRVERPFEGLSVPPTLHALVAARLDALPAADRNVLQQAAVLGTSFSLDGLAAVSGRDPTELRLVLGRLAAQEVVRVETDPRSPERGQYLFVQAVIREVAYATLAKRDRKERHLAAARWFEAQGDGELAGALARHYVDAWRAAGSGPEAEALAAQARVALRAAADRAIALHAHDQALAFLRLALEVTDDAAEGASMLDRASQAAWHAARDGEAQELLQQAIELQRANGDEVAEARLTLRQGFWWNSQGRNAQAVELLGAARDRLAETHPDEERLAAEFDAQIARSVLLLGDLERARELADRAIAVAERLDARDVLVDALITWGTTVGPERPRMAQAVLLGAITLADRYDLPWPAMRARNNLSGWVADEDPAAAEALAGDTLAVARRLGLRDEVLWRLSGDALRRFWRGETDAVRALAEEHGEDETVPDLIRYFFLLAGSGVDRLSGDDGRSRRRLEAASAIADRGLSNPEFRASLDFSRAMDALALGDPGSAAPLFEASRRGTFTAGAWDILWAGRSLAHAGRLDAARASLADAASSPDRGRRPDAARLTLQAVVEGAGGNPDASRHFVEAIRAWRELGLVVDAAFTQLDFVTFVGPADRDARTAGEELRALCDEKGWQALVARLDAQLAQWAASAGPTAPGATSGTSAALPAGEAS